MPETSTNWDKLRSEREMAIFECRMEAFSKRWAPEHQPDVAHFHAELHCLVRQIYADAQAPILKQLTDIYAAMPMSPFILSK
jgi:hypothetical protein